MLRYANWFTRHRNIVGWMLVAITVLAAIGFISPARLKHPLERYETTLDEGERAFATQVSNRLDLSRSDSFLVVNATSDSESLFTAQRIAAVRKMVAAVEALPVVESVFWADRVPVLNVFGFADPLIPPDEAPESGFATAQQELAEHPLARQLLSPDGRSLLMPVVYDWLQVGTDSDTQTVDEVLAAARGAITKAGLRSEVQVRLTGRVPLFAAQKSAFDRNQIVFQSIGYALALVLASLMFRGVAAVAVVSIAPALGVFWALGLVKLLGVPMNPLAEVVMPVLVSMIGLTDGVHLLVQIRRRRLAGDSPVEAARDSIERVGLACWLTSLTTAIGFASLLLASSDYVREFGLACCVGVLVAFLAVVGFVPYVCSTWVGQYVERGESRDIVNWGVDHLDGLIAWMLQHRWPVAIGAIMVTALLTAASLTLKPDNRLASAMPASSEAYQALVHSDEAFGGIEFFRIALNWPEDLADDSPQVLDAIRDAEQLIKDEPLLGYPLSIRAMLASFPGDPENLETQMTFLSLLPTELRGFFYRPSEREAVISVRMQDRGIAVYRPIFERLTQDFAKLSAKHTGFTFRLEGQPIDISRDLYQIVDDLRVSLGTASAVILLVLAMVYRSVRIGMISVVPNLFPLVVTGAWLAASGNNLDMSSVCAFVVCLGIAVDDTIHFLSRFHQEMQVDGNVEAAVRRAFVAVGSALIITTVILVTGFGTMLLSDLPGHRTFAAMACSTIAAAIIGDLIALPALLSCFYGKGQRVNRE